MKLAFELRIEICSTVKRRRSVKGVARDGIFSLFFFLS